MRISSTNAIEGGRVLYTIGRIEAASTWHPAHGSPLQENWRELVLREAVCLAAFRVRHFCSSQGQKIPPYSSYAPKMGAEHPARRKGNAPEPARVQVCDLIQSMKPSMSCAQTR
jgi:hypothetical protein